MATIVLSVSGEGRGHASRAQVLIDLLKEEHRLIVYAYGAALDLLESDTDAGAHGVEVRAIPGMRFAYDDRGQLAPARTLLRAAPFVAKMQDRVVRLARTLESERVDLVIVDFEPILPRAAKLAQIPVISIDHQQFLTHYDLQSLPTHLRRRAATLAPFVRAFYPKLDAAVVSAFFFPPLRRKRLEKSPVLQAGVLLRKELLSVDSHRGNYLVAYLRREAPTVVLESLRHSGVPIRIYGCPRRGQEGNLSFHAIDRRRFVDDLAGSQGLISTAGNQVVGEALFLRKPVLCYPEPGNFEQSINGHFVNSSGQGRTFEAHHMIPDLVRDFVENIPELVECIRPERLNGNRVALRTIVEHLQPSLATSDSGRRPKWKSQASLETKWGESSW